MKFFGVGYDTEHDPADEEIDPFEDRIDSTVRLITKEAPILFLFISIISMGFDLNFFFWVCILISYIVVQTIYEWGKYFKDNVWINIGSKKSR